MPYFETTDGIQIHYHVDDFRDPWIGGEPETVLMHHAFARNLSWWTKLVPALARKYRVVRYDVRGCGDSSKPPLEADWSAERLIKDALDLMNYLKVKVVNWVGMESGAVLGEYFSITYPHRIKSLTLFSGPAALDPKQIELYAQGESDPLVSMEKYGLREWLRRGNPGRVDVARANEIDPRIMEWHLDEQARTPFHCAYALHRTFLGADLTDVLPQILVPTLLVAAENSHVCPLEKQRFMQKQIPNAKLVVIEGIADGMILLDSERCIKEALDFLETVN